MLVNSEAERRSETTLLQDRRGTMIFILTANTNGSDIGFMKNIKINENQRPGRFSLQGGPILKRVGELRSGAKE